MQNFPIVSGHQGSLELRFIECVALREGIVCKTPALPLRPPRRTLQGTQPLVRGCDTRLVLRVIFQQSLHLFW